MIVKVPSKRRDKRSSFADLQAYITKDLEREGLEIQRTGFGALTQYLTRETVPDLAVGRKEKCIAVETGNVLSLASAPTEMYGVADKNKRVKDPLLHYIISWQTDERPSVENIFKSARDTIAALGMSDHQYIVAIHANTDNIHAHIEINRVHPHTYRAHVTHWLHNTLHYAAREVEIRYGWKHDRGIYEVVEVDGQKQIVLAKTLGQDRTAGKAATFETWTGNQSLESWCKERVADELKRHLSTATSWQDLHDFLATYALRLKDSGGGGMQVQTITEDGKPITVSASKAFRFMKRKMLESNLGPFYPDEETIDERLEQLRNAAADDAGGAGAEPDLVDLEGDLRAAETYLQGTELPDAEALDAATRIHHEHLGGTDSPPDDQRADRPSRGWSTAWGLAGIDPESGELNYDDYAQYAATEEYLAALTDDLVAAGRDLRTLADPPPDVVAATATYRAESGRGTRTSRDGRERRVGYDPRQGTHGTRGALGTRLAYDTDPTAGIARQHLLIDEDPDHGYETPVQRDHQGGYGKPPPSRRNRLHHVSELDVVRLEGGTSVLLPDHVHDLVHQRQSRQEARLRALRRGVDGAPDGRGAVGGAGRAYMRDPEKRLKRKIERQAVRATLVARFNRERAVHQAVRNRMDTDLRQKFAAARAQIKTDRTDKRARIKNDPMLDSKQRAQAYSLVAAEMFNRSLDLRDQMRKERDAMKAAFAELPINSWRSWIEALAADGDEAAISALRGLLYQEGRDASRKRRDTEEEEGREEGRIVAPAGAITDPFKSQRLHWELHAGDLYYKFDDGRLAYADEGDRITWKRAEVDQKSVAMALRHAADKWGRTVTIEGGDDEFQARLLLAASQLGLTVKGTTARAQLLAIQQKPKRVAPSMAPTHTPPTPQVPTLPTPAVPPSPPVQAPTPPIPTLETPARAVEVPTPTPAPHDRLRELHAALGHDLPGAQITQAQHDKDVTYKGRVLTVTDTHVAQRTGKATVILHEIERLKTPPAMGENVQIAYTSSGISIARVQVPGREVER